MYRDAAMATRCEVQCERALDLEELLPCGAFAQLDPGIRSSLWHLRRVCEEATRDDEQHYIEVWLTYEQALIEHFGTDPDRGDAEREIIAALLRERSPSGVMLSASEARKLQRLSRELGSNTRVNFVDASILTAVGTTERGPVVLVAMWRRRRFSASVACAVRRRARLWSATPTGGLGRMFSRGEDDLERRLSFAGSTDYLQRGVRGALRALLERDVAPTARVRDGFACVDWSHPSVEPVAIAVRLVDWLREHAGGREGSSDQAAKRRYRRWPPPAKRRRD